MSRVTQQRLSPATGTSSYRDSDLDWRERAACIEVDPGLFFGEGDKLLPAQLAEARAVCARCPVISDCRTTAYATDVRYGVRGGVDMYNGRRPHRKAAVTADAPTRPEPSRDTCGTGAGVSAHRRREEPACGPCVTFGNLTREKSLAAIWERAKPLRDAGHDWAYIASELGVAVESVRRSQKAHARHHARQAAQAA